jgi:hypothetical protein
VSLVTQERDPRWDPVPGDIVQINSGAMAEVKGRFWRIIEAEVSHGYGVKWIWLGRWRDWAKNAVVLKWGDKEDPSIDELKDVSL